MRESSTFQAILEEGGEEGLEQGLEKGQVIATRNAVRRIGAKRLGQPSAAVIAKLDAVAMLAELETLQDRLLAVESWDELLADPEL
jgi:hypothetical protein